MRADLIATLALGATLIGCGPSGNCSSGWKASVCLDDTAFAADQPIAVRFSGGPALPKDWLAVYPRGACSPSCPSPSTVFKYCTDAPGASKSGISSGELYIDAASGHPENWPLAPGKWQMVYLVDDGYDPISMVGFDVD
jgi:hypothetical protein